MLKRLLALAFILLGFISNTVAQKTGTEVDTLLLKELKQYPRKNTLPVRRPVLFPEVVTLNTASSLDEKVNYWRNLTAFWGLC